MLPLQCVVLLLCGVCEHVSVRNHGGIGDSVLDCHLQRQPLRVLDVALLIDIEGIAVISRITPKRITLRLASPGSLRRVVEYNGGIAVGVSADVDSTGREEICYVVEIDQLLKHICQWLDNLLYGRIDIRS